MSVTAIVCMRVSLRTHTHICSYRCNKYSINILHTTLGSNEEKNRNHKQAAVVYTVSKRQNRILLTLHRCGIRKFTKMHTSPSRLFTDTNTHMYIYTNATICFNGDESRKRKKNKMKCNIVIAHAHTIQQEQDANVKTYFIHSTFGKPLFSCTPFYLCMQKKIEIEI